MNSHSFNNYTIKSKISNDNPLVTYKVDNYFKNLINRIPEPSPKINYYSVFYENYIEHNILLIVLLFVVILFFTLKFIYYVPKENFNNDTSNNINSNINKTLKYKNKLKKKIKFVEEYKKK